MIKFDLRLTPESDFVVTEHEIAGEICTFVRPVFIGTKWTPENLHYRSSIWNSEGKCISASFPKFFNLEEQPHIHPFDGQLDGCNLIEKLDGSTLIVTKYNGELIIRTRGTLCASGMPNADELDFLKQKYPAAFGLENAGATGSGDTWTKSLIFEWVSPKNQIVIRANEPDIHLIGAIRHEDYRLMEQSWLDEIAHWIGVQRPPQYKFDTLGDLVGHVKDLEGKEGICLYYNEDQSIRKIKSTWYLKLHAFKSNCNMGVLQDLFFLWNEPDESTFRSRLGKEFDFEALGYADPLITSLYIAVGKYHTALLEIDVFVGMSKDLPRKEFALKLMSAFPVKVYQSYGFSCLGNHDKLKQRKDLLQFFVGA